MRRIHLVLATLFLVACNSPGADQAAAPSSPAAPASEQVTAPATQAETPTVEPGEQAAAQGGGEHADHAHGSGDQEGHRVVPAPVPNAPTVGVSAVEFAFMSPGGPGAPVVVTQPTNIAFTNAGAIEHDFDIAELASTSTPSRGRQ